MKESEFIKYWNREYPGTFPIGHELKWIYSDRWFRIHSLHKSKRYPESESEYQLILQRQNKLISDLIGEGEEIVVCYGLYTDTIPADNGSEITPFDQFIKVLTINLHKERPEEYKDEFYFDLFVKADHWQENSKNELLRAIADDATRAMFVCPAKQCIVAPYDGGIDVIVNSTERRDQLKRKYADWLSDREHGL